VYLPASARPAAPGATTVAGYLLTRLAEAWVISVFGVPGDYNLGMLDAIAARPSMAWVGTATDQGAGYAADSYARLQGLRAGRPVLIEAMLGPDDAPPLLQDLARVLAETSQYSRP